MNLCTDHESGAIALFARLIERIKDEPCCIGSSEYGPHRCTCWEAVYDLEQQAPLAVSLANVATRDEMCADCAFRPDSPERRGDDRYSHASDDEMRELDHFWCQQGMRKPVAWRHPYGITLAADTDAYDPPLHIFDSSGRRTGVPFKADGTPADRCAGFAARQRTQTNRTT